MPHSAVPESAAVEMSHSATGQARPAMPKASAVELAMFETVEAAEIVKAVHEHDCSKAETDWRPPEPAAVIRIVGVWRRVDGHELQWLLRCAFDDPPASVRLPAGSPEQRLCFAVERGFRGVIAAVRAAGRDARRDLRYDGWLHTCFGTTRADEHKTDSERDLAHLRLHQVVAMLSWRKTPHGLRLFPSPVLDFAQRARE
jgi:hypothetical protein